MAINVHVCDATQFQVLSAQQQRPDHPAKMSKGTNFLKFAIPAVTLYFLLLLNLLPVPFVAQETAEQILPVVSGLWPLANASSYAGRPNAPAAVGLEQPGHVTS